MINNNDPDKFDKLRYRQRKRRRILFTWSGILNRKGKNNRTSDVDFQKQLLSQLVAQDVQPIKRKVVLDVTFTCTGKNPTGLHHLPKHYLDLLQTPISGVNTDRDKLLLADDKYISLLTCRQYIGFENTHPLMQEGLSIRVQALSDFLQDLKLYRRMPRHLSRLRDERPNVRKAFEEWRKLTEDRASIAELLGERAAEPMAWMSQFQLQEAILKFRQLDEIQIGQLLDAKALLGARSDLQLVNAMSDWVREFINEPFVSIDLGTRALKQGEGDEFIARVDEACNAAKSRFPEMFPLLVPCGLTIVHTPPVGSKGAEIDLDNLSRKIIARLQLILKPPRMMSAPEHPEVIDKLPPELKEYREQRNSLRRRLPIHLTYYRALTASRTNKAHPKGNVRVILHYGTMDTQLPLDDLHDVLDEWLLDEL